MSKGAGFVYNTVCLQLVLKTANVTVMD